MKKSYSASQSLDTVENKIEKSQITNDTNEINNSQTATTQYNKNGFLLLIIIIAAISIAFIQSRETQSITNENYINSLLTDGYASGVVPGDFLSSTIDITSITSRDCALYSFDGTIGGDGYGLFIWDYYREDGDYVQLYLDGVVCGKPFMIRHKPRQIIISNKGSYLEIKGVRDGGPYDDVGVTYAINFPFINDTSIFNNTMVDGMNGYRFEEIPK
ncbi:MAG: hypothetical protein ACRCWI_04130 [Brevinema sp.]